MRAEAKRLTIWSNQPRRTGWAWVSRNSVSVLRQLKIFVLCRFIGFIGALCVPGVRFVGALQAWALRRMGVHCPGNDVWVGPNFRIDYPHRLILGHRIVFGADTRITARDEISIGDDFLAAPGLCLNTGTHDPITLVPLSSPITIGPGVWCGSRVTICAGASIGAGCIVGAASLVVRDLPDNTIAYGVPARPQRSLERERSGKTMWSNFRREYGGGA
ncbi:MAG TPA: hypothetical protein VHD32_07100 [Candidatus Didemnitutus sp.]|nr:hypothetical protein [Candidatus Didemnitutus sp.]